MSLPRLPIGCEKAEKVEGELTRSGQRKRKRGRERRGWAFVGDCADPAGKQQPIVSQMCPIMSDLFIVQETAGT